MRPLRYFLHDDPGVIHKLTTRTLDSIALDPALLSPECDLGDGSTLRITVDRRDALTLRPIPHPAAKPPLAVGFDTSTRSTLVGRRGGTVLLVVKPLAIAAAGEIPSLDRRLLERVVWVVLASDQIFEAPTPLARSILFDHYRLQGELENTLKHLKETTLLSDAISETRSTLHGHGYCYSESTAPKQVILLKDGSILSNKEHSIGDYLAGRRTVLGDQLADAVSLYRHILDATRRQALPVVGVTKDAQSHLLGALLDIDVPDYSILRRLASQQGVKYGLLPPLRREWPGTPLAIDYNFLYVAREYSCLRIEILPTVTLASQARWSSVVHEVARMAIQNQTLLIEHHGMVYQLPAALARSDQLTRESAKGATAFALEVMKEFSNKVAIAVSTI